MNHPSPPMKKKGPSALAIVLSVIGALVVLTVGTCLVGGYVVKGKLERLAEETVEGGAITLVSPTAVKAALVREKKDYVGSWRSARKSTLDIDRDGNFHIVKNEGGVTESYQAAIAAFNGDDIEIHAILKVTIPVSRPPTRVGDHWEMTAMGVDFERK